MFNAQIDQDLRNNTPVDGNGALPEIRFIVDLVDEGAHVLDLGCGYGNLLKTLQTEKHVRAQGIDLSDECIRVCVSKGLFVYHGDLDEGLADFNDQSMDFVISINTLQVLHRPDVLLREMARVGKKLIVSIPNFGHWKIRGHLFFRGRMPRNNRLPYEWYNTPNIHHTTLPDFRDLCAKVGLEILEEIPLRTHADGSVTCMKLLPNLLADYAVYLMRPATSR